MIPVQFVGGVAMYQYGKREHQYGTGNRQNSLIGYTFDINGQHTGKHCSRDINEEQYWQSAFSGAPQGHFLRGATRRAKASFRPAALAFAYVDWLHRTPSALLDKKWS